MESWKRHKIYSDVTLIQALQIMNDAGGKFVIVTDSDNHLEGMITDGDIRRAILCGISLESQISEIVNKYPIVFNENEKKQFIINKMKERKIQYAPIVNDKNIVIDVYQLHELLDIKHRDNIVVLMAGGLGTRLRPLTYDCPKPLLKVGNKPILETILQNFIKSGFYQFYFAVNYRSEMIENYFGDGSNFGVSIEYIRETKPLGTAGALYMLPAIIERPIVVMNGDLLTNIDFGEFMDFHMENHAIATMAVREFSYKIPYGVITYDGGKITKITEKPSQSFFVNAGIYALSPKSIRYIKNEDYFDMPDLFNVLIANDEKTVVYPIQGYWMDIGHIDDFQKAQSDYYTFFSDSSEK